MKLSNGLDVAKKLRQMGDNSPIIFITNMAQYAINGYEVNATGFIVKPVNYYQFSIYMNKAVEFSLQHKDRFITLNLKNGVIKLFLNDIAYVEIVKHSVFFHTAEKTIEIRGTMQKIVDQLSGSEFALSDRSYLVNLKYVTQVTQNSLTIRVGNNNETLPISRPRRKDFLNALTVYLAKEG